MTIENPLTDATNDDQPDDVPMPPCRRDECRHLRWLVAQSVPMVEWEAWREVAIALVSDELRRMAHDADMGNIPAERVSGGGYWFTCQEVDPTMTKERFEGKLSEWFDRRRGVHRGR